MSNKKSNSLFGPYLFLKISLVVALIGWCVITYWLFFPYQPLSINKAITILNMNNTVMAGGDLVYEYEVNKKKNLTAVVNKQLINTLIITYTPTSSNVPIGVRQIKEVSKIPNYAEPGEYRLRIEAVYKVNPLRDISIVGWSKPFQIINNKE